MKKTKEEKRIKVNEFARKFYQKNKEKLKKYRKESWQLIRIKVLGHYSNGTFSCSNCGFKEDIFCLDLDHINNDGAEKRKIVRQNTLLFPRIIKSNYPPEYQVLCRNCNWSKYINTLVNKKHD